MFRLLLFVSVGALGGVSRLVVVLGWVYDCCLLKLLLMIECVVMLGWFSVD